MNLMTPQRWNEIAEQAFAFVGLLLMLGALKGFFSDLSQIRAGTGSLTGGNLSFQIFSSVIYFISLIFIFRRFDQFLWLCWRNKNLILLLIMVVASSAWSILPEVSLRRAIALVGTTVFAVYLMMRMRPDEFMKLLAWAILLSALASLCAAVFVPQIGTHTSGAHAGIWRGIFEHKNLFGRMMALGAILFFVLSSTHISPRWIAWFGFGLCSFLVVMSHSVTALVALISCLLLIFPLNVMRNSDDVRKIIYAVLLGLIGIISLYVAQAYIGDVLQALGRDTTLSARTRIWNLAFEMGGQTPLLGHGYRVFWTQGNAERIYGFLSWAGGFGHSHNGYIDLWLDLGIVGLGLFAASILLCARRLFMNLRQDVGPSALWLPVSVAFVLITGITEQTIMEQGTIEWVLYVSASFYLSAQPIRKSQSVISAIKAPST